MEINRNNYSPNFQAKLIIGNGNIENFIKKSFESKDTFETLDKFHKIYPDSVVTINIKNLKNRNYLVAKNGVTGTTEAKLIHKTETVDPKDNMAFIQLINKIMNKKSFWAKN